MAGFDEAKFRASAKAAGYSDEEINAELGGGTPAGAAAPPSMDDTFAEKEKAMREEYDRKVKQATTSEIGFGDNKFEVPSFFTSPAGIVTAAGAGIGLASTLYGAGKVVPKVYQAVKDRWMTKVPEIDRTIDIPFEAAPSPTPNAAPTPLQQYNLTPQEVQARADKLKVAMNPVQTVEPTAMPTPAGVPQDPIAAPAGNPAPQVAAKPVAPVAPSTPLTAAPGAPAPTPSAGPNSSVTGIVADTIKELIDETPSAGPLQPVPPEELRTGTGKPAFAGQGPAAEVRTKGKLAGEPMLRNSYAKIEDVPAGYAFVPNAQNIDTARTNIGQTEYTKAYSQRPFPLTNEAAMLESSEINRMLGRPTRAEAKAAGITLPPQTPGITKPVLESKASPFMGTKAAKVGGVLGALIAIPDLAKAETAGQRGMAGANLLEAVLSPGFTMLGAGEGSSNVPSMNAAMLLGSPYAQSDIAKKLRQDQEYTRKVGSGRGIAPPSAYQK